jgi:hypothetical protein
MTRWSFAQIHTVAQVMRVFAFVLIIMLFVASRASAASVEHPPTVAMTEVGATIDDVTVETYGVVKPATVFRYLSLHKGDRLDQSAIDRDYANLKKLGGLRPRLTIEKDPLTGEVTLHWIVMAKWLAPTDHPFYGQAPLAPPVEGVGFVATSPQLSSQGSNVSLDTEFALRANIARAIYTSPLHIDPIKGKETDFILNVYGARGVFRASEPYSVDIHSWSTAIEPTYLVRGTNGTQAELGLLSTRSSSGTPTYITAPSFYDTFYKPARNTILEAGVSHACPGPPTQWYPPYCYVQYHARVSDAIGILGATNEFQAYTADIAHYTRVGWSTIALHGALWRTGGVLPTSFINCAAGLHGYSKPFCGTDAQILQAEYRIDDALPRKLKFFLLTETAASRIRGGNQPFALPYYTWHSDSGVGVMYHTLRFDVTHGSQGNRITYEFQGQLF